MYLATNVVTNLQSEDKIGIESQKKVLSLGLIFFVNNTYKRGLNSQRYIIPLIISSQYLTYEYQPCFYKLLSLSLHHS